ncbi:MAG: hypothetical protein DMG07_22580 [Acidobacteria bacterium]|nr:MAG: hypothetical protein DMG07_22580 [Acidobacteriota bacterium]
MILRRDQKNLTNAEWNDLIDAINKTHGVGAPAPRYRDFVRVHVRAMDMSDPAGMSWGVHSMGPMMRGRNFLAWHRHFVRRLEKRLRRVHPTIAIPYWDAINDRQLPPRLTGATLLSSWSVTRNWNPNILPDPGDLAAANAMTTFRAFQATLEGPVHGLVHNALGGDMGSSASPTDPLFWLHHANLDRIWAIWQGNNPGQAPQNAAEVLQPPPLFGVKVSSVLSISALGYRYE